VIGRFLVSSWSLWESQEENIVHGVKLAVPEIKKRSILSEGLLFYGARELNP